MAGKWKEVSTSTTNYRDAQKIRREAQQTQEEGRLPTDLGKLTFEKASALWLAERKALVAPKTHRIDRERSVALKASFAGRLQVKRTEKVSPRTVNLETKILRMILKSAKLWSRIADDFKALREDKRGPGRALSPEQEQQLFETAASNPQWEAAYYAALLAANTSARGGEIKGLLIGDVDLLERSLRIRLASTKTDAGARSVPLNESALWACARLVERARKLGAVLLEHCLLPAARFRHTRENDLNRGLGFDPSQPMQTWRTAWRSLTKAARLPGLKFHDLRHHAITRLAESGVAEQTLMAIAGHVSRDTLEHYSYIRVQAKRDAVALLDQSRARVITSKNKDVPIA